MRLLILVSLFIWLIPRAAFPQIGSTRCRWIQVSDKGSILDTVSVLPSSVKVSSPSDSSIQATYDINSNRIFIDGQPAGDSVLICYSVFPYNLSKKIFLRDREIYDTNRFYIEDNTFRYTAISDGRDFLNTPGLEKSGSLVRGINFGNNQNLSNTSALNIQMNGKITDDIGVAAVISDQNVPFQPEGNTQQLQEFDKVYIQLFTEKSKLTAGDLVMQNKPGYFLRFSRNVQGGQFDGKYVKDSSVHSVTSFGAAVSKGKFASTQVQPIEGVQGPYRLRGPNNERFIIVLSNSEKVYVDGKLLKRGFDFDYTIDYNQSEVTFTNNVLITKFSVIRIDFEYSEKNYGRANLNLSHHQVFNKAEVYGNFFLQRDNPNNPLFFKLDNEQKGYLSEIGDDMSRAVISGVDSVGYQENRILYRKADSLGAEIFVWSNNPALAKYDVIFTDVGAGKGSYNQVKTTANGKVFEYAGIGAGQYLPVKIVPLPQKNQMITLGGAYNLNPGEKLFTEIAFSENDKNLYSGIDADDDNGKALKAGYLNTGKLIPGTNNIRWTGAADFEYTERTFQEIDRFRDINFERDWSADPNVTAFNRILNLSAGVVKDNENNLQYKLSRRIKGETVNGWQHSYNLNKSLKNILVKSNGFWMTNRMPELFSDWKRFDLNTSYRWKWLNPGIIYATDKNKVVDQTGKVSRSAMYFDEIKFYVKTPDTTRVRFYTDYAVRTDQDTVKGEMKPSTKSNTFGSGLSTEIGRNHNINLQGTYRYLNYLPIRKTVNQNEETILTRADWNSDFFSRHIRSEITVTSGTGRELKREFEYRDVPVGTGTHIWTDFNNDGVKDLNEFVEKVPGLAYSQQDYIKVFLPTDEYIRAYTGTISYRLDMSMPRHWRMDKESRTKVFLSKFSSLSAWSLNNKVVNPDFLSRFNPVSDKRDSSEVLSTQQSLRSNLFFNRTNPGYGMDLLYSVQEQKMLLTQGYETRKSQELVYTTRVNFRQTFNSKLSLGHKLSGANSDFLGSKNYEIEAYRLAPDISWQPGSSIRFTGEVSLTDKTNIFKGSEHERVKMYEAGFETKYSSVSQRTISGNMRFIRIFAELGGTAQNSAVAYELLDALLPGNNYTWNVSWQEKLVNGLQLSFIYEGRKSENSKTIHTGRMQASAFF
jgi:hypothetical protein